MDPWRALPPFAAHAAARRSSSDGAWAIAWIVRVAAVRRSRLDPAEACAGRPTGCAASPEMLVAVRLLNECAQQIQTKIVRRRYESKEYNHLTHYRRFQ